MEYYNPRPLSAWLILPIGMLDQRPGHFDHRIDTRKRTILIVAAGINLEKTRITINQL